jgi:hypothetical protein
MFWHRAIKSSLGCRIKEPSLTSDTIIPIRFGGLKNDLHTELSRARQRWKFFPRRLFVNAIKGVRKKCCANELVKNKNHPRSIPGLVSSECKYSARSTTEESSDFARKILRKSLAPPLWRVLIRAESGDSTHKQKTKNNQ